MASSLAGPVEERVVVFLVNTLYSHRASLLPVYKWFEPVNVDAGWGRGWDEGRIPWDNVASFPWAAAGGTRSTPGRSLSYASRMLQIQEYNPAAICYLQELVIIQSVSAPSSPSQFT